MSNTETFLCRADMRAATGFEISYLYRLIKLGQFPKPVKIGKRRVAWRASDIRAWQDSLRKAA